LWLRNLTGIAGVRFGPDVFADALVRHPARRRPGFSFPNSEIRSSRIAVGAAYPPRLFAMVIGSPNRTVNRIPKIRDNPAKPAFPRFRDRRRARRVQIRFIAMLKLLFKFDRP